LDQFTYVKRGYDPEEVDKYISTLEQVIKSYKDKDNAIKNAIISAQVAADNVMRNAQMNADAYKAQIGEQLVEIRGALDRQRMALKSFQETYANMVRKSIHELEQSTAMSDLFVRLEEAETAISDLEGLEAVSGPTVGHTGTVGIEDPRADYLAPPRDNRNWDDQPRDTRPAHHEQEYGREVPRRDMREAARDDIRDVMRPDRRDPMQQPIHETLYDTDRDPREYAPPHRDERDIRGANRDTMPTPAHNIMQPEREMRGHVRDNQGRDLYQQHHEVRETPMPQDHYGYNALQQGRDHGQQMRDWDARDYAPERGDMRREPPRDARREQGRDMRDSARDVRRDPSRDMMRAPAPMRTEPAQPMRELGRQYMHDNNDYPDDEQNLLPPVASLM